MLVEVKEWDSIDKKGLPRAQIFNRIVHGGDKFNIPETPVVHEVDSDVEFEKDGKTPKKDKLITHPSVRVSVNPNVDPVDMTEYEHRMHTIRTSPLARRWSKQDKELFLKYYWYTPDWMKPANRGAQPTVDPEDSMPTKWGRDIPSVPGGQPTSVGVADTGEYVGKLVSMTQADAVKNVNKTKEASVLQQWLADEKNGQGREKVIASIEAQLKSASGA